MKFLNCSLHAGWVALATVAILSPASSFAQDKKSDVIVKVIDALEKELTESRTSDSEEVEIRVVAGDDRKEHTHGKKDDHDHEHDGEHKEHRYSVKINNGVVVVDDNGKTQTFNLDGKGNAFMFDVDSKTTESFMIGVYCEPAPDVLRKHLKFEGGMVIESVVEDAPAGKAGLQQHDILLAINDETMSELSDLMSAVQKAGESEITVKLIREGKEMVTKVTPQKRKLNEFANMTGLRKVVGKNAWARIVQPGVNNQDLRVLIDRIQPGVQVDPKSGIVEWLGAHGEAKLKVNSSSDDLDARFKNLEKQIDKLTKAVEKMSESSRKRRGNSKN